MRSFALVCAVLAGGAAALMLAAPAQAQATRTWVSGVGDDANPCSRTAPCKTFAGAISKTAAGGEINCLDPGGFGALTINKSLNIVCDYTEGGVLAGSNGFVINALATDKIYLSGLDFHGVTGAVDGIRILNAASVIIRNVAIRNFVDGIEVANSANTIEVSILDSVIANNTAIGINIRPTVSGTVRMTVTDTQSINNAGAGLIADTSAPTSGTVHVSIRNSVAAHNGGNGFAALSAAAGGTQTQLMIDESVAMNNNSNGIVANGSGALIRVARSNVTRNTTGVATANQGAVQSYTAASNTIDGNGVDGVPTTTPFK